MGAHLKRGIERLVAEHPRVLGNPRGRGLMCAVDFRDTPTREAVADRCFDAGMIILGCGVTGLRFRPPLDVTAAEVDEGLGILRGAILKVAAAAA